MRLLLAVLTAAAFACGGDDDGGSGGGDGGSGGGEDGGPDCTPPAGEAAIVYLNRDGATYTQGPEDTVDNTTLVVEEEEFVFEPHPYGDGNWNSMTACIRAGLSRFHIDVVEEDPGAVDHTEIVFSTTWLDTAVASISAFSCNSYRRAPAFIFGDLFAESDWQSECDLALQQFGVVAAGLDHSFECRDYMSYLNSGCDGKEWVDEPLPCGELEERDCKCDRASQNSYQIILERFGPACAE